MWPVGVNRRRSNHDAIRAPFALRHQPYDGFRLALRWHSRDARRGPIAQQMMPIANLAYQAVAVTPVSEKTLMSLVPMAFMTIRAG